MPTAVETLQALGIDLTPEQAALIPAKLELADEFSGVIKTKNDLLQYKQETAPVLEQLKADRTAEIDKMEKLAIENNDVKSLLAAQQLRADEAEGVAAKMRDQSLSSKKAEALTSVASMFNDSDKGSLYSTNFVSAKITEDGEISVSYQAYGETFDSVDGLKSALLKKPSIAGDMRGTDSGGAGGSGGQGGNGSAAEEKADLTKSFYPNS